MVFTSAAFIAFFYLIFGSVAALASTTSCANPDDFFRGITGDWIGVCEQKTDGEQAEDKYFRATVSVLSDDTFDTRFEYFRLDEKTGDLLSIGSATIITTLEPDGTAVNEITGQGTVMVNDKPKNQRHELQELLTVNGNGTLEGLGTGRIEVSEMPLGIGKNGKVQSAKSTWEMKDGVLNIQQSIRVGFRALIFTKHFDITANYTAQRGTDVASLITKGSQASLRPTGAGPSPL